MRNVPFSGEAVLYLPDFIMASCLHLCFYHQIKNHLQGRTVTTTIIIMPSLVWSRRGKLAETLESLTKKATGVTNGKEH